VRIIGRQNDAKEAGRYTRRQEEATKSEGRDASILLLRNCNVSGRGKLEREE
jgi:hypothetical protein